MLVALFILLIVAALIYLFLEEPKFGKKPAGERLEIIKASPNYKDGQFQNLSHTPQLSDGASYTGVMGEFFFGRSKRSKPNSVLPSQKTNLFQLLPVDDVLVWFGHSSYFLQVDGKKYW